MNKSIAGVIVGLIAVLAVAGIVMANRSDKKEPVTNTEQSSQTNSSSSANGTEDTTESEPIQSDETSTSSNVEMSGMAFSPSTITVKKGTTVTWTNKDSAGHDVTPDEETDEFKKSDLLDKDQTYQVTFNTPGTYEYHCSPHPFMRAKVIVTE